MSARRLMSALQLLLPISSFTLHPTAMATFSSNNPYPPSYATVSSSFAEPAIPDVAVELRGNWMQHKWDENVSHIAAGYWYNSKSQVKVRVDETYDGALGSSLFDYTDINSSGQVLNKQYLLQPSVGSKPDCFTDHVNDPAFPLVTGDLLHNLNAVFGGVAQDSLVGWAQSVSKSRSAPLESIDPTQFSDFECAVECLIWREHPSHHLPRHKQHPAWLRFLGCRAENEGDNSLLQYCCGEDG
jgi:hypothetical protein